MPTYISKPKSFLDDPANIASKFPRPLQRPGGMILQGLKDAMGGDDPSSIMQVGMPMGAMEFPNKVPDLPVGKELVDQVTEQMHNLNLRGTSIKQLGEEIGEPWSKADFWGQPPNRLITDTRIEPSTQPYYDRAWEHPEVKKWMYKLHGLKSTYDNTTGKYLPEPEPDMSESALQGLIRFLAD